jgi:5-methylcytosine-specific restriction endonuclease McrA
MYPIMSDIAQKAIVLKLNCSWQAVQVAVVQDTIIDLVAGVVEALDINYKLREDGLPDTTQYEYVRPVEWDEWITLPIRPWDPVIHTCRMAIRVPTVVITKNYNKMPMKKYKGKPTKEALFYRDSGKDIYTGEELDFDEATIDHIVPRSRGGDDVFENTGLTTKEINNGKGNQLNSEAGLHPHFRPTAPREVPIYRTIRKIRHDDWKHFLNMKNK